MAYYDIMVIPVPESKLAAYKKMLKASKAAWQRCGAASYVEAMGEDLKPGKLTSFPQSVKAKKNEHVFCAILTFRNKTHRNQAWKKFMSDPFVLKLDHRKMPMDGARMFFGGFKPIAGF